MNEYINEYLYIYICIDFILIFLDAYKHIHIYTYIYIYIHINPFHIHIGLVSRPQLGDLEEIPGVRLPWSTGPDVGDFTP